MKRILSVLCLLSSGLCFAGCALVTPGPSLAEHQARIDRLRAQLPYVTRILQTRSMETVINPGSFQLVRPKPFARLQTGDIVVYWPYGSPTPVAHFLDHKVGTVAWQAIGMNQPDDFTSWGWLVTPDNSIGVIH